MLKRKSDIFYVYGGKKHKKEKEKEKKSKDDSSSESSEDDKSLSNLLGGLAKKSHDSRIEREYNHIYFYSEVDRDSIYELNALIKEAEEESILTSYKLNIDEIPIYIHISSYGGSVFAAFNAIDIIQACKVPIHTIIDGATASAGTLISIMGKKRYIRPNAQMLIHQLSSGCWGKMSEIEDEYKNLQQLMERIREFYREKTKIPKKELNDLLKHDLWLNKDKCLKYGLVDEVWN